MKTFKVGGNRKYSPYLLNSRLTLTHKIGEVPKQDYNFASNRDQNKFLEILTYKNCGALHFYDRDQTLIFKTEKVFIYALGRISNFAVIPKIYKSVSSLTLLAM